MTLLDTDHTTFLKYPESERGRRMIDRLDAMPKSEVVGVAIVTVEERMRGWLAVIAKEKFVGWVETQRQRIAGSRPSLRDSQMANPRGHFEMLNDMDFSTTSLSDTELMRQEIRFH